MGSAAGVKPRAGASTHHSDDEWTALYPDMKRLYVQEGRKLRHVMSEIEWKYGFKATPQMYKKRFSKWGFQKPTKQPFVRLAESKEFNVIPHPNSQVRPRSTPLKARAVTSSIRSLHLDQVEKVHLLFLTSIRNWSSAFFESDTACVSGVTPPNTAPSPTAKPINKYDSEQLSFSFRVISSLVDRGHGVLAGRMARKSFLEAESLMQVEGPLFIWNTMEILHSLLLRKQFQTVEIFIRHLSELVENSYSTSHPATALLYSLRALAPACRYGAAPLLIAALEKGWSLNAGIVFNSFHSRFLLLYYRLVWDSALIQLPPGKAQELDNMFATLDNKMPTDSIDLVDYESQLYPDITYPTPHDRGQLPLNYQQLRDDAILSIRHRSSLSVFEPTTKSRILSAMLKSKIIEDNSPFRSYSKGSEKILEDAGSSSTEVHPLRARVLAYVMKILMETDMELGYGEELAVPRLQSIITLRKYAQGSRDPQVIFELLQLESLLLSRGHTEEAEAASSEAFELIDDYLVDIPTDSP